MSDTGNLADIMRFLEGGEEGTEKVAQAQQSIPSVAPTGEAFEKVANAIEQEQFTKMSSDAWTMGEIMAEGFHARLQKLAMDVSGDQRRGGEIMQSIQGDQPMAHRRQEDLKDLVNVATPVLMAAINQPVTNKVPAPSGTSVEVGPGEAPVAQPAAPPDVQETDQMAPKTSADAAVAEDMLLSYLRGS